MPDRQSEINSMRSLGFALRLHLLCCYNIDLIFLWLILHPWVSLSSRIQNNNKSHETIGFESTHCNDYSILFSFFRSFDDDDFSRPFAFFVWLVYTCENNNKTSLRQAKQCLLAMARFGISFVLFIAFVQSAHIVVLHIFIFHHQVLSSIYPAYSCSLSKSCGESGIY